MERKNLMKKFVVLALTLILALSLCACGGDPETSDPAKETSGSSDPIPTTPKGYTFTYNEVQFGVNIAVDGVIEDLGEPADKYTSESCAFGGKDTVYYYPSIEISANDENGYERIFSIYIKDDLVSTEEGISVGSTADAVKDTYGEPGDKSTENNYVYAKDGMSLSFIIKDGSVASILYNAD